ncbi:DUF6504 family protein [uncultured Pseudokineococcus sp.]|uniref:DUF6504 family protein n=1 Tax=uncultured Pseudokineococcus sp. TaxID=1642928 RepID=UPI00262B8046|nr:DUF6504 family protein [uncultured Pseudokineococcus sp.]
MARTYDDEVDVRTSAAAAGLSAGRAAAGGSAAEGAGSAEERPEAFVWHGRLHVVRAVLGRWYERRAWWEQDPQRDRETSVPARAASSATAGATGGAGAAPGSSRGSSGGPSRAPSLDREVWQVEASTGRAAGCGVYELCREDPAAPGGWSLRRVDD